MITARRLYCAQSSTHLVKLCMRSTPVSASNPRRHYTTNPRYLVSNVDISKTAIKDSNGSHSFEKLSQLSTVVTDYIRSTSIRGARVALLIPPSLQYAAGMIGVMNANCVPVPLNHKATDTELEYLLNNCEASVVLTSPETDDVLSEDVTSMCIDGTEGRGSLLMYLLKI